MTKTLPGTDEGEPGTPATSSTSAGAERLLLGTGATDRIGQRSLLTDREVARRDQRAAVSVDLGQLDRSLSRFERCVTRDLGSKRIESAQLVVVADNFGRQIIELALLLVDDGRVVRLRLGDSI